MSEPKHTPGPWTVTYEEGDLHIKSSDNTSLMCNMKYDQWTPDNEADWYLYAAAPDLLDAATAMRDHLDKWQETGSIATPGESKALYDALSAAIAKATEGAP